MSRYQDFIEKLIVDYRGYFEVHDLEKVDGNMDVYHMAMPGTGIMHVYLGFYGGRIAIFGDAMVGPEGRGVISVPGNSLRWFLGELGADYMAEKFLPRVWVKEKAIDFVDDELEELGNVNCPDEKAQNKAREEALWDIMNSDSFDEYSFRSLWEDCANDFEDWPDRGYEPRDVAMLAAIHERFRELYKEL